MLVHQRVFYRFHENLKRISWESADPPEAAKEGQPETNDARRGDAEICLQEDLPFIYIYIYIHTVYIYIYIYTQ